MEKNCPSEVELARYLDCRLSEAHRQVLESHIANCQQCLDLLVVARQAGKRKWKKKEFQGLIKRIEGGLGIKVGNNTATKWLMLSIIFFMLSFIFSRYFLQFLIGATILALKWVFEGEGAKRVVMIFKKESPPQTQKNFERKSTPPSSNIMGGEEDEGNRRSRV